MKAIKYLLVTLVSLVLLLVIGLAVFIATFDANKYKLALAAAVLDRTGRTLTIDGNLGLSFYPSIGIASGKMSLSEPNSSRIFARLNEARLSLALLPLFSRQVVVDRILISGLAAELVKHKNGTTNFDDLLAVPGHRAVPRRPATPGSGTVQQRPGQGAESLDIAGVEIRASTLSWQDESSGQQYKATIDQFTTGRIASGVPGELSLAAHLESSQPRINARIQLSSIYRLDMEKKKISLTKTDLTVSDESAGAGAPATSLKGDVELDLAPQAIRFDLALDRLNLDALQTARSSAPSAASGNAAESGGATRTDTPVDLSALKGLNVKGSLKVGELIASNVKLEKLNLGLQASGGRMNVTPLQADLYQGRLDGSASVDAGTNRVALKSKLSGVSVGPLLHDALDNNLLEGRGDVMLDVQTGGPTVGAMKKSLAGSAKLALQDAALKGINLTQAVRKARALGGSTRPEDQAAASGERTDFTELSASFVIRDGVAHNDDLSGKSPLLRLSGSGDVDIGNGSINYLAKVSVVRTASGQGGKDLSDLQGVTVPVKITGPLEAPRFRVDLATAAGEAVKQRAEEKLKERVRDKLKGLLGR
jgi:AsmA protein